MIAYGIFLLVNIGSMLLMGQNMREGWLGLVIGGIAGVMASYSRVMDFEDVQHATEGGVPRKYAWRIALGLAVTLIWLQAGVPRNAAWPIAFGLAVSLIWWSIEFLRLLAIPRGD